MDIIKSLLKKFPAISELNLGLVAHACNPSTWDRQARESRVQGHPQLCSKFEASLDYRGPCV